MPHKLSDPPAALISDMPTIFKPPTTGVPENQEFGSFNSIRLLNKLTVSSLPSVLSFEGDLKAFLTFFNHLLGFVLPMITVLAAKHYLLREPLQALLTLIRKSLVTNCSKKCLKHQYRRILHSYVSNLQEGIITISELKADKLDKETGVLLQKSQRSARDTELKVYRTMSFSVSG